MSKCLENVKRSLIENINGKTKELKQVTISLERMGIFSNCPEKEKGQYKELLNEIIISSQHLEHFSSISHIL